MRWLLPQKALQDESGGEYIGEKRSSLDDCIKKLMDIECIKYNGHLVLRDSLIRCQKDLTTILGLPISNLTIT